jgi:hypothetical protein
MGPTTVLRVVEALRRLWDFGDLDETERRFGALVERTAASDARADVLTQLARVAALRGDFAEGERLLDEAEALAGATARVDLERGRLRRSSGDAASALPLFEAAFEKALAAGDGFLAGDAAHMAALAAPDPVAKGTWTRRGIDLAESAPDAAYWLGPLLNNLGWERYEAGDYEAALDAFRGALAASERDRERRAEIEIARYAVGKALRALARAPEALPLLEEAVAWTATTGEPDGWFHEELAECYAALGRRADAGEHARLALPLLAEGDPSFTADPERAARLEALAAGASGG